MPLIRLNAVYKADYTDWCVIYGLETARGLEMRTITTYIAIAFLWAAMLIVIGDAQGAEHEKKVVIHVPSAVKHIHHHHTNKVVMKPKRHQGYSGGWRMGKGSHHGKHTNHWAGEDHDLGGGDHEWHESKAVRNTWYEGDDVPGSRSLGGGKKQENWHQGYPAKNYGGEAGYGGKGAENWHGGSAAAGRTRGYGGGRGHYQHGGGRGSRYEVKEEYEEQYDAPEWDSYDVEEPVDSYRNKPSPVSSYEVKGHKGNSYSSVVIHNPKSRRHSY
ncbi:uncharacterized protein [Periplaneta americana]|uniref:uncharacterized protein n=1 Tax=Periplaneta americana TaxID=6978 RepID=UPI0037E817FD